MLQALVDTNCKLLAVEHQSDAGNFRTTWLNVPADRKLPEIEDFVPFVMISDEAYPLFQYLMRPYLKRILDNQKHIYNYWLSRARRSVECAVTGEFYWKQ